MFTEKKLKATSEEKQALEAPLISDLKMLCWCAVLEMCLRGSYGIRLSPSHRPWRKKQGAFAEHPCMHKLFPFYSISTSFAFLMPRWSKWKQNKNKSFCRKTHWKNFSFHSVLWWRLMAFVMGQHLYLVIVFWSVQNYCLFRPLCFPSTHFKRDRIEEGKFVFRQNLNSQEERTNNKQKKLSSFPIEVFSITFARLSVAMPRPFPPTPSPVVTELAEHSAWVAFICR